MRVFVAAWVGSTNLGDEMIFASVARRLHARGAAVSTVSVHPERTLATHGPVVSAAVDHRSLPRLVREIHRADAVVFGGGGLLQDETSQLNLPYHLSRPVLGRLLRKPLFGLGLGAGPLYTAWSRFQVRHALASAAELTVRDQPSAELLRSAGVEKVRVTADAALALPPLDREPEDLLAVSLRSWTGRGWTPSRARRHDVLPGFVDAMAEALQDVRRRTGLGIHFVAFQRDWDGPLHRRVAERLGQLGVASSQVAPTSPDEAVAEIGRARTVVAMRYHAGISAVLAARPVVLVNYSPKMQSLAEQLGEVGRLLPLDPSALRSRLCTAVEEVGQRGRVARQTRRALRSRETGNESVLDRILSS